jgi:hypothetical protein
VNTDSHRIFGAGPSGRRNKEKVLQGAGGLRPDVIADKLSRASIKGSLAGSEEKRAAHDGLGVGGMRRQRSTWQDDMLLHGL